MNIENSGVLSRQIARHVPAVPSSSEDDDRHQEHFKTDHLLPNLKGHTISSGAVTISAQGAKFLLNLVSTMALARLLTPRDFGLVAMVTTVTGFVNVFKDAGLSIATVQRERITHAQVSNLFWVNVAVSALGSLIVAAAAPVIAGCYHNPLLIGVTFVLSTTFIISGVNVQHQALLKRQMRFKSLAFIEVGSMAIGVVVGVVMAVLGCRYWSLVGSSLSMEIAGFLLTWSISRWRPTSPTRRSGTGPLLSFGAHRTAGDLLAALAGGTDILLIGRFYGAASVGLYSRAGLLLMRPLQQFLGPINAVFIPALSRLQSQPDRYRSTFLHLYEAIALTAFFFAGLFLALAHPLTLVVLGPKWEQAAVIFAAFTVAALSIPLTNATTWLLTSQGRGRDILIAQSINSCALVASFVAGLPYGPVGVAIAFSCSSLVIRLPLWYFIVGRRGPVRTADLFAVFFRHIPVWIVTFFATWLMRTQVPSLRPLAQLLICAPVGFVFCAAFICTFNAQRRVVMNIFQMLWELRKRR
ncbi:MAG: lipopolysaccharide biosynthesis protein [Acidobacteria bacterium]|nr:MAG: lipopolysaccharide biosynthesis protein [Acidobacteriota bacterium]